jgi:hypothetical protein
MSDGRAIRLGAVDKSSLRKWVQSISYSAFDAIRADQEAVQRQLDGLVRNAAPQCERCNWRRDDSHNDGHTIHVCARCSLIMRRDCPHETPLPDIETLAEALGETTVRDRPSTDSDAW